jgi:starch phosphorylase
MASLDVYLSDVNTWFAKTYPDSKGEQIAYFSAEYALHESLPIYSGGLGVLSGDHCKSASDLGLPFVAVGLLYRQGYFVQQIDQNGNQRSIYPTINFDDLPIRPLKDDRGNDFLVPLEMPGRSVWIRVWQARVGRTSLFLLDTDVPQNTAEDRLITYQLYGGDREMRLCQEMVLGIGGVRVLRTLQLYPSSWHMNEGHSVFQGLERARLLMKEKGLTFQEALEIVRSNTVFTTHTPVAAGHDVFSLELIEKYFSTFWSQVGISREDFLHLGLEEREGHDLYNLTLLAFRMAGYYNGVSRLHGEISSRMWAHIWPEVPAEENPVTYVTNGVHTSTWISPLIADLFDQYLGPEWYAHPADRLFWRRVRDIPDDIFWGVRQAVKRHMVDVIRDRVHRQLSRNGASAREMRQVERLLDPEVLTIGFGRRFATYKRATLIFRDPDRLARILNQPGRPVQIIFSGKAHPADKPGQELIQQIHQLSQQDRFKGKVLLLEGYDMSVSRYLIAGVDVWLNNPRRPHEASGTSGMKAALNGGINLSISDGWWCEGYEPGNGWVIGGDWDHEDTAIQDRDDAESLYDLLENDVVPLYYHRNGKGFPEGWVKMSKESIRTIAPFFSTDRMVQEYSQRFYLPGTEAVKRAKENGGSRVKELTRWKEFILERWSSVTLTLSDPAEIQYEVGSEVSVDAIVDLGGISPDHVALELYVQNLGLHTVGADVQHLPMKLEKELDKGAYLFRARFPLTDSGRYGYKVRVVPCHPTLRYEHEMSLIRWA